MKLCVGFDCSYIKQLHRASMEVCVLFGCSYNKLVEQKEELEQKHLHLLQILDSERQAKWHYVQQTEEMTFEVKRLKAEVCMVGHTFSLSLALFTVAYIVHTVQYRTSCSPALVNSFFLKLLVKLNHVLVCSVLKITNITRAHY